MNSFELPSPIDDGDHCWWLHDDDLKDGDCDGGDGFEVTTDH